MLLVTASYIMFALRELTQLHSICLRQFPHWFFMKQMLQKQVLVVLLVTA